MIFDRVYIIDWARSIRQMLPAKVRTAMNVNWLKGLIYPIVILHSDFTTFRRSINYRLSINYQVCYLEKLLNDRYDYVSRRIRIEDVAGKEPVYVYTRNENKPVRFYTRAENKPVYFFTRGEVGAGGFDAVIKVPAGVVFTSLEMLSLVKRYCLPAMKITIQIV